MEYYFGFEFSFDNLQGTWSVRTKDWHSTEPILNGDASIEGDMVRFWEGECTLEFENDCGISTFRLRNPPFENKAMRDMLEERGLESL